MELYSGSLPPGLVRRSNPFYPFKILHLTNVCNGSDPQGCRPTGFHDSLTVGSGLPSTGHEKWNAIKKLSNVTISLQEKLNWAHSRIRVSKYLKGMRSGRSFPTILLSLPKCPYLIIFIFGNNKTIFAKNKIILKKKTVGSGLPRTGQEKWKVLPCTTRGFWSIVSMMWGGVRTVTCESYGLGSAHF